VTRLLVSALNRGTATPIQDVEDGQALMAEVNSCIRSTRMKRQKPTCQERGRRDELQAMGSNELTLINTTIGSQQHAGRKPEGLARAERIRRKQL
jgi:hypothetical protein